MAVTLAATAIVAGSGATAPASGSRPTRYCTVFRVPVTVPGASGASVSGWLCLPSTSTPKIVQLLVHGGTYNRFYWDWPDQPEKYSYVDRALRAGHATFAVDRLGVGQSTRPHSDALTMSAGAEALHQVVTALREGRLAGRGFDRVVWVGHSYGTMFAWVEAATHSDVDAFVLTGQTHFTKESWIKDATASTYPAVQDPKFANSGLDFGYLTTVPGSRGRLFYHAPNADPAVIARDEQLKDTLALPELVEGSQLVNLPPPDTAPSRAIRVPTLLVLGEHDNLTCGPPDGIACTESNVLSQENPYYAPEARLQVRIVPATGHDLQLHHSAAASNALILDWLGGLF